MLVSRREACRLLVALVFTLTLLVASSHNTTHATPSTMARERSQAVHPGAQQPNTRTRRLASGELQVGTTTEVTGDIVLVIGFHHSGTTLLRHMLANGHGAVEHPPDSANTGLVPCKWLGPASPAAKAQNCGDQAKQALSRLVLSQKFAGHLPVVVAKKTGNSIGGLATVMELVTKARMATADSTTYKGYVINWRVREVIFQIRDPLDSVWSVFKREYGADGFDREVEKHPCAVESHYRRAWAVLREYALLSIQDSALQRSIVPFSPHVNRRINAGESCGSYAKQASATASVGIGTGWCWSQARGYIPEAQRSKQNGLKDMCRLQKAEVSEDFEVTLPAHIVQYEKLVRDPKASIMSTLAHLRIQGVSIDYTEAMVNTTAKPLTHTNVGSKFKQMTDQQLKELGKQKARNYDTYNSLRASQVNRPIGAQRVSAWQRENSEERQELLARLNLEAAIAAGVVPTESGNNSGTVRACVAPVSLNLASMSRAEVIEKSQEVYRVFAQVVGRGEPALECLQRAEAGSSSRPDSCGKSNAGPRQPSSASWRSCYAKA